MAVSLYMKKIYEEVGSKSDAELEGKLTIEKNLHLLRDEVAFLIEEVLEEHPLPYQLKDFQKLVLHQIGSLNNVILVSPTGSGKMVVIYQNLKEFLECLEEGPFVVVLFWRPQLRSQLALNPFLAKLV